MDRNSRSEKTVFSGDFLMPYAYSPNRFVRACRNLDLLVHEFGKARRGRTTNATGRSETLNNSTAIKASFLKTFDVPKLCSSPRAQFSLRFPNGRKLFRGPLLVSVSPDCTPSQYNPSSLTSTRAVTLSKIRPLCIRICILHNLARTPSSHRG